MRHAVIATVTLFGMALGAGDIAGAASVPHAVKVARTTTIPACTSHVDAAFVGTSNGTATKPYKTIAAAVAAANAKAIICVAQGVYAEQLSPGTKPLTLAGGFQRGKNFTVRDSAKYVSKAKGNGVGSFVRIEDPGPTDTQLTAIDGFEIFNYSQAIYRDIYYSQRFDITNNNVHDNVCADDGLAGAAFALNNVSGNIRGNVFSNNKCGRGGAGALNDSTDTNSVSLLNNLVQGNSGTEPESSHGGAFYLFNHKLVIKGNAFTGNKVTAWGAGLYLGAFTGGGQHTTATLSWNVYQDNSAGSAGGGLFCDDSAHCTSDHEIYYGNCGGNIYLDGGPGGAEATVAKFDHLTNFGARSVGCGAVGEGVQIDKDNAAADSYSFKNSLFWGNGKNLDFSVSCISGCSAASLKVTYSMVQKTYASDGGAIQATFGPGIVAPVNPLFVSQGTGDFHLKSKFGHWTSTGYVTDPKSSPALAKGDPASPVAGQPPRAGTRTELGAYGNSSQASYVH